MSKRKQSLLYSLWSKKQATPTVSESDENEIELQVLSVYKEQDELVSKGKASEEASDGDECVIESSTMDSSSFLPTGWKIVQWRNCMKANPWLFSTAEGVGCIACRDVKSLLISRKGVRLSSQWAEGKVHSNNVKKLRDKIQKHKQSVAHEEALNTAENQKQNVMGRRVEDLETKAHTVTNRVFTTAYYVAKERLAFVKLKPSILLQELNGLDMGGLHRSDHSCFAIIDHIAKEMRAHLITAIIRLKSMMSITIDETSLHGKEYMIIFLRCDVSGHGDIENIFLEVVELKTCTSLYLYEQLKETLYKVGFTTAYLEEYLIGISTDGAAVMTGKKSGLTTMLANDFPRAKAVHCLAHRLELAVRDSLECSEGCNQFETFMSKLHMLYSASPKNARLLEDAADEVGVTLKKIGKIFSIRWVASSYNTVNAVWGDYKALVHHLQQEGEGGSQHCLKYKNLYFELTSNVFVKNLALMRDVLLELQRLSRTLQKAETSLVTASKSITVTIINLISLKESNGDSGISSMKLKRDYPIGTFQGITLNTGHPLTIEYHLIGKAFIEELISNIKLRMPDSDLIDTLKPLDKEFWPEPEERSMYGEYEVDKLARSIGINHEVAIEEYRRWKYDDDDSGKTLTKLLIASKTYLATSSECERGFSALSDIESDSRNRLGQASLSPLLFIAINGPPLMKFNPKPFVKSWLKQSHKVSTEKVRGKKAKEPKNNKLWSIL